MANSAKQRPLTTLPERPLVETTSIYDLFIDIPHPAASLQNGRAYIIEPPGQCHPGVLELFDSASISRIAMFSFPDYDPEKDDGEGEGEQDRVLDDLISGAVLRPEYSQHIIHVVADRYRVDKSECLKCI